jgi:hypothetical protein
VFEFFKVAAPERIGFAKHREVAERKAAALTAAAADAGETATSPRTAPTKKTSRKTAAAAAATAAAAAEGKARKKRGGRPADSPPAAKRTRVVDVETGVVRTVIAAVPLRSAAPSGEAGEETGGPLLVLLSPKEKDNNEDSDVRNVSSVGEASRGRSPTALGHESPRNEGKSSSTSSSSSSSSSENTEQSATPSAPGAEKDDFVAAAEEDEEEEEPESNNYRVTPENPQAAAACLQIPPRSQANWWKTDPLPGLDERRPRAQVSGGGWIKFRDAPRRGILWESQLRRPNHRLRGSVPEGFRSVSVSCPKVGARK